MSILENKRQSGFQFYLSCILIGRTCHVHFKNIVIHSRGGWGGETWLKFEPWKVQNHIQNVSQHSFYCFLKEIWILKSSYSQKSPTHVHFHTFFADIVLACSAAMLGLSPFAWHEWENILIKKASLVFFFIESSTLQIIRWCWKQGSGADFGIIKRLHELQLHSTAFCFSDKDSKCSSQHRSKMGKT